MLETANQIASVIAAALAVGAIVATWLGFQHRGEPRKIRRDMAITTACTAIAITVILVVALIVDGADQPPATKPDPTNPSTAIEPDLPATTSSSTSSSSFPKPPTVSTRPVPSTPPTSTSDTGPDTTDDIDEQRTAETIVIGMGVSVSPRSGTVSCAPGDTFVFTFEVAAKQAGTVEYVLRPEEALNQPEQSGSMTFSAANTQRVQYTMPRSGSPGQQLRGGLLAEVTAPDGDRGIVGDQYDVTCQ